MLRPLLLLPFFVFSATTSAQDLVINGDFEANTAFATEFNLSNTEFNSTVSFATGFGDQLGDGEIDVMNDSSGFGLAPQSGDWKLGIASDGGGPVDAFALELSAPVVSGELYQLEFFAHAVVESFSPDVAEVQVGISDSSSDFGAEVFSAAPSSTVWKDLGGTFVAPAGGSYLTVRQGNADGWNHVDNFSLVAVPEPSALVIATTALFVGLSRQLSRGCHRQS